MLVFFGITCCNIFAFIIFCCDKIVRVKEMIDTSSLILFEYKVTNQPPVFCSYSEPQKFSKDGYEEHLQVNHLAPALLSILLLPSLIRGSPSRIVNVNSIVSLLLYLGSDLAHQSFFSSIFQSTYCF